MLRQKNLESFSRSFIDQDIAQWLKHRQQMWLHYTQLKPVDRSNRKVLQEFCQLLMDYLSFGHFRMFEKLEEFYQSYPSHSEELDKNLLNKIASTTDLALDFNEKYTKPKTLETLSADLSQLGEMLAHRMEWEDALVKNYSQFCSQI